MIGSENSNHQDMMKLLSVVIPVFNVESFIERCIRSLENQDIPHNEYEVICVNDGSPDNSREVITRLGDEYNNIILVDQMNQGVSVARNVGLEKARGQYVLFIDPDDYVMENSFNGILKEIIEFKAQMVIPGYLFVDEYGNILGQKIFDNYASQECTGIEAYYLARETGHIVTDTSVGVIFNTAFLKDNQLFYKPGVILNQDAELLARIHCIADRCIFTKQVLYSAVERRGSASRSNQFITERVRDGFILAANNLKEFQSKDSLRKSQKQFLNGPIAKFVLLATYSGATTVSLKMFRRTVRELGFYNLTRLNLKGCSRYHFICGFFYNLSPYISIIAIFIYLRLIRFFTRKKDQTLACFKII
jgi:glycosyltransferase involved in cell wall biosynthesis